MNMFCIAKTQNKKAETSLGKQKNVMYNSIYNDMQPVYTNMEIKHKAKNKSAEVLTQKACHAPSVHPGRTDTRWPLLALSELLIWLT